MKVSEDNWQRLLELLDSYLELGEPQRAAMLARTESDSAELGANLRQLIEDFEAGALLSAREMGAAARAQPPKILTGGRVVGRYRLTKVIGRGAMSAVWLAEQRGFSGARPVALKFLFSSTARVHEQARLTELHHAGIARLLDSGTSEDGQPYLVWEFVDGLPLLKHAAARSLIVARRVALFIEVLTALSHAHAQLALHRSLKPSNILVDTAGHAHLLDFGTSSYPPGRSDYGSPEQILGEAQSTASDVYSAGVVLYELLTGQRPYRLADEVGRTRADAILAAHVPPLAAAAAAAHAANCGCTLPALRRQLDRDLDAIVQKSLHKDPAQRYASADGFAQDLGRWLRRERVGARRDSAGYRVAQFLRRNPLLAGGIGCVLLALTLSLAVAVGKTRAARLESARAVGVSRFLAGLFSNPPHTPAPAATDLLDAGLARIQDELADNPQAQIDALGMLAVMYAQLDRPEGAGRAEAARLELMASRYGADDPRVIDALLEHAEHLEQAARPAAALDSLRPARAALDARHEERSAQRARLLLTQSRIERYRAVSESEALAAQAVTLLSGDDPQQRLVEAFAQLADARLLLGDLGGAREALVRAAGSVEQHHAGDARWQARPLCGLAVVQARLLEIDDAEAKFRQCLVLSRQFDGAQSLLTRRRELSFARLLQDTGRNDEARALLAAGADSADFWQQDQRVQAALDAGQLDEARQRLDRYLPAVRERYADSLLAARAALQSAALSSAEGRFADAVALQTAALAEARRSLGAQGRPGALNALLLAASRLDLARGEPAAALEDLQDVRDPVSGPASALTPDRLEAQLLHARALAGMNRPEAAASEAGAMLESLRRSPLHAYLTRLEADASLALAQMQVGAERYLEAQLHAERALGLRQSAQDPRSLEIAEAQLTLARSLTGQRQLPLAQRALAEATALIAAHPAAGPQYTGALRAASDELNRALHPPRTKHR